VFAQLAKNLENACIKARRHGLSAKKLVVFLRKQDFREIGVEMKLSRATAYPSELFEPLKEGFEHIFQSFIPYRLTRVVLADLEPGNKAQYTLFDDPARIEKMERIYDSLDLLSARFGKHTVHHAASLPAKLRAQHDGMRGDIAARKRSLFRGENARQRLGMPMLHMKV
jgi:DNA polymerase-4/DNA polymerase V